VVLPDEHEDSTATLPEHETGPRVVITIGPGRPTFVVLLLLVAGMGTLLAFWPRGTGPTMLGWVLTAAAATGACWQLVACGHDLLARHPGTHHETAANRGWGCR
jgi:hypothetical protein